MQGDQTRERACSCSCDGAILNTRSGRSLLASLALKGISLKGRKEEKSTQMTPIVMIG